MKLSSLILIPGILLLSACSGGGGGDDGDTDSGDNARNSAVLDVSESSFDIVAHIDDGTIALEHFEASITNIETSLNIEVYSAGSLLSDLRIEENESGSTYSLQFELDLKAPEEIGLGSHSGFIRIYVCNNQMNDCLNGPGQIRGSPFTVNISYTVTGEPIVHHVWPYTGKPGASKEVTIHGVGFSQLDSPVVRFGVADALDADIVSDTTIIATYPALVAGEHAVSVLDKGTPIATEARLMLADEPDFDYQVIGGGVKSRIIYDAERRALLALNSSTLTRHVFSEDGGGNQTWTSDWVTLDDLNNFAMTPDGRYLIVTSTDSTEGESAVQIFDPVTLERVRWVTYVDYIDSNENHYQNIAMTASGRALLSSADYHHEYLYVFNYRSNYFMRHEGVWSSRRPVGASGDGLLAIAPYPGSDLFYEGEASTADIFGGDDIGSRAVLLDYDGDTIAINRQTPDGYIAVYGADIDVFKNNIKTGTVVPALHHTPHFASGLSADGARLYVYSDFDTHHDQVAVYDLTSPDGSGGFNHVAGSPHIIDNNLSGQFAPEIVISPEEKTLFIGSGDEILVYPLP